MNNHATPVYGIIVCVHACLSRAAGSRICYCHLDSCHGNTQIACTEDEVCFARLHANLEYIYGCIEVPESAIPSFSLQKCFNPGWLTDLTTTQCCNDTNLCNQHLDPPLPPEAVTMTATPEHEMTTTLGDLTTSPVKGETLLTDDS